MFADYIHVEPDADKVQKFTRSVKKVSWLVYRNVFNALLSHQEDALDTVYRYLILAFAEGRKVEHMLISPEVMRIMELGRSVSNEAHLFREIARFTVVQVSPHCPPVSFASFLPSAFQGAFSFWIYLRRSTWQGHPFSWT